jgi:predicted lipoprotein
MKQLLFILALPLTVAACGEKSSTNRFGIDLADFDRLGLLKQLSEDVIQPRYLSFSDRSQALKLATESLCQNLAAAVSWTTAVTPVQVEWKQTMALWQEIEAFQFGPLAEQAATLRYDIYTWPLVNACAVDRQIGVMAQNTGTFSLSSNDSTKSLSAMEYLLFDNDSFHACKESVTETQGWNERGEASRHELRCGYLRLLAADLVTQSEVLQKKWNDGSQGYHYLLIAKASDSELQSRINTISDSLFYLDATVKDKKLGLHVACSTGVCPEIIEHNFSQQSLSSVQRNLIGFQAAFTGGDALGFDDYLKAAGGEDLADRMQVDLEKAVATVEMLANQDSLLNFVKTLDQAACAATRVDDRRSEICALYQDIKSITDELKTEFVEILKLTTPAQSSGDND